MPDKTIRIAPRIHPSSRDSPLVNPPATRQTCGGMRSTLRPYALAIACALPAASIAAPVDDSIAAGTGALSAHLWESAAVHFQTALAVKGLPPETNARIALLLAESWIRSGRFSDALALLDRPTLSKQPTAPYWRALALDGRGKPAEAAALLQTYVRNPGVPHHAEALFSLTGILLDLARPDDALAVLDQLVTTPPGPFSATAALRKTEILLDLGRTEEAAASIPDSAALKPAERAAAAFAEARLLLLQGRPKDASTAFRALVDRPAGQTLRAHHLAFTGLAESLAAIGKKEEATTLLFSFLTAHPNTPVLSDAFRVLISLFPETPAATDPILEKLAEWIPASTTASTGLIAAGGSGALDAWPAAPSANPIVPYALYARASGLARIPAKTPEAIWLFERLHLEYPAHPLAARALYQLASHLLAGGRQDRAMLILEVLRGSSAGDESVKGEAAFLEARAAFAEGDTKLASRLYASAAASLTGVSRDAAVFNSALVLINTSGGNLPAAIPPAIAADLELERVLATADTAARKTALEAFLAAHPGHSRAADVRRAIAEAALALTPPDLNAARVQLTELESSATSADESQNALIKLRLADAENNSAAVIPAARAIIAAAPDTPDAADAAYILARHLFLTRSYNDARLVIEKLAATTKDPARAQAAWLLAARSAALVPTPQSRQESLILFDKAISIAAPLAPLARIEKARLLIDGGRLAEAASFLRPWFASLKPADPLYQTTGLLLAEAVYANGGDDGSSLEEALAVYDKLLAQGKPDPATLIRIQYLRGRALEQLPDPKDPAKHREQDAFLAYYSVLEAAKPPAEWHYFELCGFRALALLEKEKRWPAAIACARRIASFKGPRAEEATARASQIQLENMVWED